MMHFYPTIAYVYLKEIFAERNDKIQIISAITFQNHRLACVHFAG